MDIIYVCSYVFIKIPLPHPRKTDTYGGRPNHFKFVKGCLPQTLLGAFLNTLTHIYS